MSLLPGFVRGFMRLPVRGRTRLPLALARRFPALQTVAVEINGSAPIYVDLRDASSHSLFRDAPHRQPPWEWVEQEIFARLLRPGDVVLDVGANRGLHTVRFSAAVGPSGFVLAVEPNPELVRLLERTVRDLPQARVLAAVLGDCEGSAELMIPENHEMASLADWTADGARARVPCAMRRMDALIAEGLLPPPDLMKVDVEGAELLVFRGGACALDRPDAPIILFEENVFAAPRLSGSVTAAARYLAELPSPHYQLFAIYQWGMLARHLPQQIFHGNLLAVPDSRLSRWPSLAGADFIQVGERGERAFTARGEQLS